MNKDLGPCWAKNDGPARHKHHILPVQYGGPEDGRTVNLCPSCHDEVHSLERKLIAGEKLSYTPHPNITTLVKYVVQQYRIWQDSGGSNEGARNMVQFSCTAEEKAIAHDLKRRMGMRSLERMFKLLMFQEYERRVKGKGNTHGRS